MTVVMRGKINKTNEWVDQQILFRAPAELYNSTNAHYGSRFLFDKQNHLFFTLGEKQQMADAQDLSKPTGKIHRVNDDGSIPKDNPFVGTPARPVDLELRPPQPAGAGVGPGQRQAVGIGARAAGRRRNQHHRAEQELRLGRHHQRHPTGHHQAC